MKLIKDETAKSSASINTDLLLGALIAFMLIGYVGPIAIQSMVNATGLSNGKDATATGFFAFGTGNISNGDMVNITNATSKLTFEFNTSARSPIACIAANCIPINLTGVNTVWNNSQFASGNLTTAINANASAAAIVTATNTSNLTSISYYKVGSEGNGVTLTDSSANIVASGLSGGQDSYTSKAVVYSIFTITMPIIGVIAFLLIIYYTLIKKKGK